MTLDESDLGFLAPLDGIRHILSVTPTYEKKAYCHAEWLEALLASELPPNTKLTALILVNGNERTGLGYFQKVIDSIHGLPGFFAAYIPFHADVAPDRRVATLYNIGRLAMLSGSFQKMLTLESDVILRPKDLALLDGADADAITGVTTYADEGSKDFLDSDSMVFAKMPTEAAVAHPLGVELDLVTCPGERPKNVSLTLTDQLFPVIRGFPAHRAFTMREIAPRHGIGEVESTSLGCMLIKRHVLAMTRFRTSRLSAVFPDYLFSQDVRFRWPLKVHWDVRPKHLPREWYREGIKVGYRDDVVTCGAYCP